MVRTSSKSSNLCMTKLDPWLHIWGFHSCDKASLSPRSLWPVAVIKPHHLGIPGQANVHGKWTAHAWTWPSNWWNWKSFMLQTRSKLDQSEQSQTRSVWMKHQILPHHIVHMWLGNPMFHQRFEYVWIEQNIIVLLDISHCHAWPLSLFETSTPRCSRSWPWKSRDEASAVGGLTLLWRCLNIRNSYCMSLYKSAQIFILWSIHTWPWSNTKHPLNCHRYKFK